ncbi:discoidin domain-containing protein [Pseudoxanthomonas sp. GM95]|uniref:galactose-binding domain-containing protein n=1 Tax=Pseudoxanthomonas sp. GM95 TaxID=1881043 RepID=UPI000B834D76|nr:discoidin domain-containing protein [Pseudoxanthomonas sp. GM95]
MAQTSTSTAQVVQHRSIAIGDPVFKGDAHPVPDTGVPFAPGGYLPAVFAADQAQGAGTAPGHDFWIDRMLARNGNGGGFDDTNNWLFTRGRAAYLYTHKPEVPGFVGEVAYWHKTGHDALFRIKAAEAGKPLTLVEDTSRRRQTPSYFSTAFADAAAGVRMQLVKFITQDDVAVAEVSLAATDGKPHALTLTAVSPMASHPEGGMLTGAFQARNDITTVFPKLSGDGFRVDGASLTRRVEVPASGTTATYKLQLGLITRELPSSLAAFQRIAAQSPQQAYLGHVTAYNRWWADNIPYLDTPEDNIDKTLFYRWWLLRFNFLDADVPGNDYQFPVAIEGVLGYNNAIVLTTCMFLDDLKYLRDPTYAYGSWIGAGEVAASGKYADNPGSPENWSNSYAQYLTDAAWRSYELHGGPAAVAGKLARYGRDDVLGLLKAYDSNGNGLIEYDWAAMTGNDADAVSFDWAKQHGQVRMDRTESAYVYANALASAHAARVAGDLATAKQMEAEAAKIRSAVLSVLWQDHSDTPDTMGLHGDLLKHRQVGGPGALVDWKETNNYYPFTVGLMPKAGEADYDPKYVRALRLFADADQYPIFPFHTANQADRAARGEGGSNNFSVINSTVTFRMLGSVLRDYPSPYLDAGWYRKLLYWNAWAHDIDGDNRYPDQNEFWAKGSADDGGHIGYRSWIHHTQLGATNFTVIEDAMGLRPRSDAKIELYPIDIGWDHFAADNIRYRDRNLSIVWDKDGRHYGGRMPKGYSVFLDGKRVLTLDRLTHVVYDPASGQVELPADAVNADAAGAQVLASQRTTVLLPEQVVFDQGARIDDVLQKAGVDPTLPVSTPDLALGARVTSSFAAPGFAAAGAVDGSTVNEPFWGTAGSPSDRDWIDLDLGKPQRFDDVRLYFYRSSSPAGEQHGLPSGTRAGYAPPWMYQVQVFVDGLWKPVPGQVRDAAIAQGNRNRVRFPAITAQRLRVQVVHAGALRTGLKEVQVYATGTAPAAAPANQAPQVVVWQQDRGQGTAIQLRGQVGDDALPHAQLAVHWQQVQGPAQGEALFGTPDATSTLVRFTAPGRYILRLVADDGALQGKAEVRVDAVAQAVGQGVQVQGEATATAQQTASHHRVQALNDGFIADAASPPAADRRWGSWGRAQPASVWLQYQWPQPQRISASTMYFWDDQPDGGVMQPVSWKLQFLQDQHWVDLPVTGGYPLAGRDKPSRVHFAPVTTTALRAVIETATQGSGRAALGVDEWQVFADRPERLETLDVRTGAGQVPTLPDRITGTYADGSQGLLAVRWPQIGAGRLGSDGHVEIHGLADGGLPVTAQLWVRASEPGQVNTVDPLPPLRAVAGSPVALPAFATVQYNDGSRERRSVHWPQASVQAPAAGSERMLEGVVQGRGQTGQLPVNVTVRGVEPAASAL